MAVSTFVLSVPQLGDERAPAHQAENLSDIVLRQNVIWYVRLRWIVIGAFWSLSAMSLAFPSVLLGFGIMPQRIWPMILSALLVITNLFASLPVFRSMRFSPAGNLWFQIVTDLLVLTAVVHFVGALSTPVSFLYSIHIALACIFFSAHESFCAALVSSLLYSALIILQASTLLGSPCILIHKEISFTAMSGFVWNTAMVVFYFLVIWYIVSRQSEILRVRERQLVRAEAATREAQREKDYHAVMMTHELKSPLDSICSALAMIMRGYHGVVTAEIKKVLGSIEERTRLMGEMVIDILKLSRLRLGEDRESACRVDLFGIIRERVSAAEPVLRARGINLVCSPTESEIKSNKLHMQMLFENLIGNAINYSRDGGRIEISGRRALDNAICITITDYGIGIRPEILPRIFDDYFRAKEASKHNPWSTGLGLAFVKSIAARYSLRIEVMSEPEIGTSFSVLFPPQ